MLALAPCYSASAASVRSTFAVRAASGKSTGTSYSKVRPASATGFKLSASGCVTFGAGFVLSAESQIICREAIRFGRDCLVSWEVLILDTDFHPLETSDGGPPRLATPITFGDRVWIGARATILKGVELADDVVVGAASVVSRSIPEDGILVGGNPAVVLRRGVRWQR